MTHLREEYPPAACDDEPTTGCVGDLPAFTTSREPSGLTVTATGEGAWSVTGGGKAATVTQTGWHGDEPKLACDCAPFRAAVRQGSMRYCTHTGAVERHILRARAEARRVPSPYRVGEAVTLLRVGAPSDTGTVRAILPAGNLVVEDAAGRLVAVQLGERATKGGGDA